MANTAPPDDWRYHMDDAYSPSAEGAYNSNYYSTYGSGIGSNPVDVSVHGYYRSNGTYVQPYHRTAPNYTTRDNYNTAPNYNPYTGQYGRRR